MMDKMNNFEQIFKGGKKPNERIAERLRNIIDGKEKQDTSWCGKRDSSDKSHNSHLCP